MVRSTKYYLAALGLLSAVTAQQCGDWTCESQRQAISQCGRQCIWDFALSDFGCGTEDYTCQCPNIDNLIAAAVICVWDACGGFEQAAEVGAATRELCTCVETAGNPSAACLASSSVALPTSSSMPPTSSSVVASSSIPPSSSVASVPSSAAASSSIIPSSVVSSVISSSVVPSHLISSSAILSSSVEVVPSSAVLSSASVISSSAAPSSSSFSEDDDNCTDEPDVSSSTPVTASSTASSPAVATASSYPVVKPTGSESPAYPGYPGYPVATPGPIVPGPKYPTNNNTRPGYEGTISAPTTFTTSCTETEGSAPVPTQNPGKGHGGYYQPTQPQPAPGGKGDDGYEISAPEGPAPGTDSGPEYGSDAPGAEKSHGGEYVPPSTTPGSDHDPGAYLPVPGSASPPSSAPGYNSGDAYNPVVEAGASSTGKGLVTLGVVALAIAAGVGVY